MKRSIILLLSLFTQLLIVQAQTQNKLNSKIIEKAMLDATKYMVENVSNNGGYVWYYLPDFSRQWGEMEAFKTMIWLQHPGTISMGHLFLDAYRVTGNEYYYKAAHKAASAIIWGQSHEGGWNYMIDFAGDRSLKQWYNTIGKNGWRLEEFQHYYGNSTFDDNVTSDAARFLLRMYLEKLDPAYKPELDKAIEFILKSQYPNGGWPQRYPMKEDFSKNGLPDYTSFYTFNDDVIWENVHFLIQCYLVLGEERYLDPIYRGMDFYVQSQDSCGAWGQQLDREMKVAGARTYEPAAFLPGTTCENTFLLLKFYQYTGDPKFIEPVPKAISWLEATRLPNDQVEGRRTHPTFINPATNKPIYVHRKGSNVKYGRYYTDTIDTQLLAHYYGKAHLDLDSLKEEYDRLSKLPLAEITKDSPLAPNIFTEESTPQSYYNLNRNDHRSTPDESIVLETLNSLDDEHRWLTKHVMISNPYIGEGQKKDQTEKYATTMVGDETDTSPYRDVSDQEYISTREYLKNMQILINYLESIKYPDGIKKSIFWY